VLSCKFGIAEWILSKNCDVHDFADRIRVSNFHVVCVALTTTVTSRDPIYKFLEHLAAGATTAGLMALIDKSRGGSMPLIDLAIEVLREKAVLCLERNVWIVVKKYKVVSISFEEFNFRCGGTSPDVSYGQVDLLLNAERQISVGVLFVHRSPSKQAQRMLCQWLVLNEIAVLCSFGLKGDSAYRFASSLAKDAGAFGWAPCAQMVDVKNSSGDTETKAHPSFITLFGYCSNITWPAVSTAVPDDFEIGPDVLRELVPQEDVPYWNENFIGSTSVPKLGHLKQKPPNFDLWCRNSFQNCVWMRTSIPFKKSMALSNPLPSAGQVKKRIRQRKHLNRQIVAPLPVSSRSPTIIRPPLSAPHHRSVLRNGKGVHSVIFQVNDSFKWWWPPEVAVSNSLSRGNNSSTAFPVTN